VLVATSPSAVTACQRAIDKAADPVEVLTWVDVD
jgi:flavin-binding protein dodecin